mgnify:CR=1 FL=1
MNRKGMPESVLGLSPMTISVSLLMLLIVSAGSVSAQNRDSHPQWKTDAAFREALSAPVSINWEKVTLKESLDRLSAAYGVCIVLDRRVDPGQSVDFECQNLSLAEMLKSLAGQLGLGVCPIGSTVYIGPASTVNSLPAVIKLRQNEVLKLPPQRQTPYTRREALHWDDLDTPRDIAVQMVESSGLILYEPERIPHDLWAGADLPPMNLVDRLTLIGAGFHETFIISPDGRQIAMTRIPDDLSTEVTGSQISAGTIPNSHQGGEQTGSEELPPIHLRRLTATVVGKPFREVLEKLCEQMQLNLTVDWKQVEAAGVDPGQLLSFTTNNATVDQLLDAILKPTGCTFQRNGIDVKVLPPSEN